MGNATSSSKTSALTRRLSRTSSGPDNSEKGAAPNAPVEKLTKMLAQMSSSEDSVQGITCRAVMRNLFPRYPELGLRLFGYLHVCAGSTTVDLMTQSQFKTQVEKLVNILDDEALCAVYVKMFSACNPEIRRDNFRDLLLTVYRLAMDHYPEGPQTCIHIHRTIDAVTEAAFHRKDTLNVGFATHWIQEHCPRLMQSVHKYVVHVLTTSYRNLRDRQNSRKNSREETPVGLELATPVVDKAPDWGVSPMVFPLSQVWLLSTSLPPVFTRPQQASTPPGALPSPHHILLRMMGSQFPSHWLPLYNSSSHGHGSNRFLTHVLHYRGPTLTVLISDDVRFLLAVPEEWKESHLYWGSSDATILQLTPEYHIIERGPKTMYLNFSIRGYPHGIRAGADPRKPSIIVDADFGKVQYKGVPYPLKGIEVWGCGLPEEREAQLEVKKWQVKEAEKQRVVKINAKDWVDHPDRYLLELNGRPIYNASSS